MNDMKLKKMIKSVETVWVVGTLLTLWLLGMVSAIPIIVVISGYVLLNLTGLAVKDVTNLKGDTGGELPPPPDPDEPPPPGRNAKRNRR